MAGGDGYETCPRCGHHTSAYCGACTAFVLNEKTGLPEYCGCDCVVAMGGKSFHDTIAAWFAQDGGEAKK